MIQTLCFPLCLYFNLALSYNYQQINVLRFKVKLCMGSTPKTDNAEHLSQYDPGC